MYDIIYDYIINNIFNSTTLSNYSIDICGVTTNMNVWLTHTACIVIMVLAVILACLLVRWVWRIVSSAMLLK